MLKTCVCSYYAWIHALCVPFECAVFLDLMFWNVPRSTNTLLSFDKFLHGDQNCHSCWFFFPQDWHSLSIDPMWTVFSCLFPAVLNLNCLFAKRAHLNSMNVKLKYESIMANTVLTNVIYTSNIYIRLCGMHLNSEWFESTLSYVLLLPNSVYTKLCVFLKIYKTKRMSIRYQGYL